MRIAEQYYKNLLDKLFDGIVCIDRSKAITYWNKAAEKIAGHSAGEVIGRAACSEILSHSDRDGVNLCKGSCIIEKTLSDGVTREGEYYIKHKEGHRIPIALRLEPVYNLEGQISGVVQIFHDNSSRIAALNVIEKLKKLANRRYVNKLLDSKTDEMKRYGLRFGVLYIDIDHFKSVNDNYGHDIGDKVLWNVSRNMSTIIRSSDILGRWGGEEFIAIILNVDRDELYLVAEKLRSSIEKAKIRENGHALNVTISIGASLVDPQNGADKESIIKKADKLLYESKTRGRNRVSID
jgi:diguanylate cyclase (GGDEF)-like protein/PAS domain S-box-containing protein